MREEYSAKIFRSGNSVALRLPKALGLKDGDVARIVREDVANFTVRLEAKPKRKFNIEKVWGCAADSGLQPIRDEDRVFEHRALLWDEPLANDDEPRT